MKVRIDKNGMLIISAESETEAYALKCWMEKNIFYKEDYVPRHNGEVLIEGNIVVNFGHHNN